MSINGEIEMGNSCTHAYGKNHMIIIYLPPPKLRLSPFCIQSTAVDKKCRSTPSPVATSPK